jgi:hypothetical protein
MQKTNKHIEELLPEYIGGMLSKSQEEDVKLHLDECASCRQAYEQELRLEQELSLVKPSQPSQKLKKDVFAMIEEEKKSLESSPKARQAFLFSWQTMSRVAAAVLLVAMGYWWGNKGELQITDNNQVAEMKQEIGEIKEMLMLANLKAQYPSERIQAVSQVENYSRIDPKLIEALVTTLNTDASPNVRLAAANALQKFATANSTVRAELVRSLEFQTEPIVQISLINMMVELEEKSAVNKLKSLIDNEATLPEVRKQAQLGIEVLI